MRNKVLLLLGLAIILLIVLLVWKRRKYREPFSSLSEYHTKSPHKIIEGNTGQSKRKTELLKRLAGNNSIKSILEIGFNGGHSSETFLEANSKAHITSFDIGLHKYVKVGKEYIDMKYPGRHKLIIGNSLVSIPQYASSNPDKKFDIIFIDGGHEYNVSFNDLVNCKRLAHKDTIVIMDDTIYTNGWHMHWTFGPTKAWTDGIERNIISETSHEDHSKGRGISWGKYLFNS